MSDLLGKNTRPPMINLCHLSCKKGLIHNHVLPQKHMLSHKLGKDDMLPILFSRRILPSTHDSITCENASVLNPLVHLIYMDIILIRFCDDAPFMM